MSTIEDFKNAPPSATATCPDGTRAMKMDDDKQRWVTPSEVYLNNEGMVYRNYTLDAPVSTTVREALDLAWELAHEVKVGQVIPEGARYLEFHNSTVKEYIAYGDREINVGTAPITRTLEPLPEQEHDWLDAPAVMARVHNWHSCADPQVFTRYDFEGEPSRWICNEEKTEFNWVDLVDVTPLYPKGQEV